MIILTLVCYSFKNISQISRIQIFSKTKMRIQITVIIKVITDLKNFRTVFCVNNSFMWEISTQYEILNISMCYLLVDKCILSYNQAIRVKHKLSCDIFLLVYHLGAVLDRLRVSWKALHFRIGNGLFGYLWTKLPARVCQS